MTSDPKPKSEDELQPAKVAQHGSNARELLNALHEKTKRSNRHPELQSAITELEMALHVLTIKTGALLLRMTQTAGSALGGFSTPHSAEYAPDFLGGHG